MSVTTLHPDLATVEAGFAALAHGDPAGFAGMFHDDAVWDHHNHDRLGGEHRGKDAIMAYLATSMELTAGTLRPLPIATMTDGRGSVVVLVSISGMRPDGRTFADSQVLVLTLAHGLVSRVDQHVGDPAAVTAFWA
jgi:uncharacterized protein